MLDLNKLHACRRLAQNTSICSADAPSLCRNSWLDANLGRYAILRKLPLTSPEILK